MNRIEIKAPDGDVKISRHIYGHFSEHLGRCIYGGYRVGGDEEALIPNTRGIRNDVAAALKRIRIPNLRWPGGCFADEYHWKDGIGPAAERPRTINTHWGGVIEDNSFGTHEFLDLCEQLGCEPYICGNMGSGTVEELSRWVEYCNFGGDSTLAALRGKNGRTAPWKVRFWGIGNENWGCGGNMAPEFYACNYRRYATYARNYGDTSLYKIACGPNTDDYNWTRVLMEKAAGLMNGLSLHYYTVTGDWERKGSATEFDEAQWFAAMKKAARIEELVREHGRIMDEFDPQGKVGLVVDEWGMWHDTEPGTNPGFLFQQNTLRDALVAAIHLNVFNNNARRVSMANIAQTVNVLQSLILTEGKRMIRTPTYHVYDMYKVHQDAVRLPARLDCETAGGLPSLSASASRDTDGRIHISIANIDPVTEKAMEIDISECAGSPSTVKGQMISSEKMQDHNTFEKPETVTLQDFTGAKPSGGVIHLELPPKSAVTLEITG